MNIISNMRIYLLVILFCSLGGKAFSQTNSNLSESEKKALLEIYNTLGGEEWNEDFRWNLSQDPKNWVGVDIENGHVTGLMLQGMGLKGEFPGKTLLAFPELKHLSLASNLLTGKIPAEISQLTKLESLRMGSNLFVSDIPDLSKLKNLLFIDFSGLYIKDKDIPKITSPLPDLSKLPKLLFVDFSNSNLEGQLPTEIGNCIDLIYLDVSGNRLTGSIPTSLSKCAGLRDFSVMDNELSGEIPDLSALSNLGERNDICFGRLYLQGNKFTGNFPEWVASLSKLKRFGCGNNQLSGTLPEDLSFMSVMESFFVNGNNFTGPLPKQLPNTLEHVDFRNNQFTGSIPKEWQDVASLNRVMVSNNNLSGVIPPIFKKAEDLEVVFISGNNFTFSDIEEWKEFITNEDCKFFFGIQKPYNEGKKVEVNSGATVTFDATYTGTAFPKTSYQWFNLVTGMKVEGNKEGILELTNVSTEQAADYACFYTTDYFKSSAGSEGDDGAIFIIPSGKYSLWVDGKHASDKEDVTALSQHPYVYPTVVQDGQVSIAEYESVLSVWMFDGAGQKVLFQDKELSHGISVAHLTPGTYHVFLLTQSNEWVRSMISVR